MLSQAVESGAVVVAGTAGVGAAVATRIGSAGAGAGVGGPVGHGEGEGVGHSVGEGVGVGAAVIVLVQMSAGQLLYWTAREQFAVMAPCRSRTTDCSLRIWTLPTPQDLEHVLHELHWVRAPSILAAVVDIAKILAQMSSCSGIVAFVALAGFVR